MVTLWTNKGRELESLPIEHLIRKDGGPFFEEYDHKKYIDNRDRLLREDA
jgi:hypothetical protein